MLLALLLSHGCSRQAKRSSQIPPDARADAGTLRSSIQVTVSGLQNREGKVLLALYAAEYGWPGDRGKSMRRMESNIENDQVTFTIPDVPVGRYAISVLHDENDNDEMETDFFGRPKEGFGFSQNVSGTFGPPGFDDAAFELTAEGATIHIELVYN
jgi:uncharacterized protein (DUF2141 family)